MDFHRTLATYAESSFAGKPVRDGGFRSHVLDIEDDLHGKKRTALTLQRVDFVEQCINTRFAALQRGWSIVYDNGERLRLSYWPATDKRRQSEITISTLNRFS